MDKLKLLEEFVESRQNDVPIIGAYGYGSKVFKQIGNQSEKSMIDILLIVEDAHQWKLNNMINHRSDYPKNCKIFRKYDLNNCRLLTGLTFQNNIPFYNEKIKVGITGISRFDTDMTTWDHYPIPGRFQKPTHTIIYNKHVESQIQKNREKALITALLLMSNDNHTLKDLYVQISKLSYLGDIRVLFAEDPFKSERNVHDNFEHFVDIYGKENEYFYTTQNQKIIINHETIINEIYHLPTNLSTYLIDRDYLNMTKEKLIKTIIHYFNIKNRIDSIALAGTSLLTTGGASSMEYVSQKILKKIHSKPVK